MTRAIEALPTWHNGIKFRSLTEARWSAFLLALGVGYEYEPGKFELSAGGVYIPDFWIPKFHGYLQVKPANESIKHLERHQAEQFSADHLKVRHWFGLGAPRSGADYLQEIHPSTKERIKGEIMEDARDEGVFWLASDKTRRALGGWGKPTLHDQHPLETKRIRAAYMAAQCVGRIAA
jgi:hypothetical protein